MTKHATPSAGTVFEAFAAAARAVPDQVFLIVPASAGGAFAPDGTSLTYRVLAERIGRLAAQYRRAGYGHGHRVGLLLENRPAFFVHWLALNALGAVAVPINPYYERVELVDLFRRAGLDLTVTIASRHEALQGAAREAAFDNPIISEEDEFPAVRRPVPMASTPDESSICALLYTSGTTGTPKGCLLSNRYFHRMGAWYLAQGGLCALAPGHERLITPLPLYHMNAMACSTMAMILACGTLVQLDRFHPDTWWADVAATGATIFHYLGVMPAILLNMPPDGNDTKHSLKFGFGANADPAHHAAFEARFGVPLIEAWAMTETGGGACIAANRAPRNVGARCIGRAETCDVQIVDADARPTGVDQPGELLVRNSADDPRAGFFSGYDADEDATTRAWSGGWFHTGDIVRRDADGLIYFVDRDKHVIRRSGENISALEIETVILQVPGVAQVAVVAQPDEIRGQEVLACIVPTEDADEALARAVVAWCLERLAYYKAPGHVVFMDSLPTTATQKVRKSRLGEDARLRGRHFDLRDMKRRRKPESAGAE